MIYKLTKKYLVMEISQDGLLKTPKNSWGESIFSYWGYDTQEEAEQAILEAVEFGPYVVIPKYQKDEKQ